MRKTALRIIVVLESFIKSSTKQQHNSKVLCYSSISTHVPVAPAIENAHIHTTAIKRLGARTKTKASTILTRTYLTFAVLWSAEILLRYSSYSNEMERPAKSIFEIVSGDSEWTMNMIWIVALSSLFF